MKNYQYEKARLAYGEDAMIEDYKEIYEDMKEDTWELERDNKQMVANVDKCVEQGGSFYVSLFKY